MGMYTELILGCSLSQDTPSVCIKALDAVINDKAIDSKEVKDFISDYHLLYLLNGSSYYFGVNKPNRAFWYDDIDKRWHISTRSNIKNYENEIECFLDYLANYVEQGSGEAEIYAYVLYEESRKPKIYSLKDLEDDDR